MARRAKSTEKLLAQVNAMYPGRSKLSDGWIGDAAHASRKSDHNPNAQGVVRAIDITHDPEHGFDSYVFAETLRLRRDPRILNVISNGRIFSSRVSPWVWRKYTGANSHAKHVHVSVSADATVYDDDRDWNIVPSGVVVPPPPASLPVAERVRPDVLDKMGQLIVDWEARRDKSGHIVKFTAPDGSVEIAGINAANHPAAYKEISSLLDRGDHEGVERAARVYVLRYSDPVAGWVTDAGLQMFLRDSWFNRGPTGSAKIMQIALGTTPDGNVGSTTRDRLGTAVRDPDAFLTRLRSARETYEDQAYPNRRRSNQWQGMVNRWDKALVASRQLRAENQTVAPVTKTAVIVGTVAAGGAGGVAAKKFEFNAASVAAIVMLGLIVAMLVWKFWPRRK